MSELLLSTSHSSVGVMSTTGVAAADVQLLTLTQLPSDVSYSIGGLVLVGSMPAALVLSYVISFLSLNLTLPRSSSPLPLSHSLI